MLRLILQVKKNQDFLKVDKGPHLKTVAQNFMNIKMYPPQKRIKVSEKKFKEAEAFQSATKDYFFP